MGGRGKVFRRHPKIAGLAEPIGIALAEERWQVLAEMKAALAQVKAEVCTAIASRPVEVEILTLARINVLFERMTKFHMALEGLVRADIGLLPN